MLRRILAFRTEHRIPTILEDPSAQRLWARLSPLLPVMFCPTPSSAGSVCLFTAFQLLVFSTGRRDDWQ
jgi:hypothetical protein